jgi:hypothetical protein
MHVCPPYIAIACLNDLIWPVDAMLIKRNCSLLEQAPYLAIALLLTKEALHQGESGMLTAVNSQFRNIRWYVANRKGLHKPLLLLVSHCGTVIASHDLMSEEELFELWGQYAHMVQKVLAFY